MLVATVLKSVLRTVTKGLMQVSAKIAMSNIRRPYSSSLAPSPSRRRALILLIAVLRSLKEASTSIDT